MIDLAYIESRLEEVDLGYKTPCHIWQGRIDKSTGYGRVGRNSYAHLVHYELVNGPVPEGLVLHHLCNNGPRGCARADHLLPMSHAANMKEQWTRLHGKSLAKKHLRVARLVHKWVGEA